MSLHNNSFFLCFFSVLTNYNFFVKNLRGHQKLCSFKMLC